MKASLTLIWLRCMSLGHSRSLLLQLGIATHDEPDYAMTIKDKEGHVLLRISAALVMSCLKMRAMDEKRQELSSGTI